jgi:hypothetical protein
MELVDDSLIIISGLADKTDLHSQRIITDLLGLPLRQTNRYYCFRKINLAYNENIHYYKRTIMHTRFTKVKTYVKDNAPAIVAAVVSVTVLKFLVDSKREDIQNQRDMHNMITTLREQKIPFVIYPGSSCAFPPEEQ